MRKNWKKNLHQYKTKVDNNLVEGSYYHGRWYSSSHTEWHLDNVLNDAVRFP